MFDDYLLVREPTVDKCTTVDKCGGCKHVKGDYCDAYTFPGAKWRAGNCPLCSTVKIKPIKEEMVNPIKKGKSRFKVKK